MIYLRPFCASAHIDIVLHCLFSEGVLKKTNISDVFDAREDLYIEPFPAFNKSAADNFENTKANIWKIFMKKF